MNETILFGFIFAAVAACLIAFGTYHIYSGLTASLNNAKVGEIYNFEYLQPNEGDHERHLIKVIGVHVLSAEAIQRLNSKSRYRYNDPVFQRTSHLVTGQSADGTIRNFYAERTQNVRRPLLGGVVFKTGLANLLF